MDPPDPRQNNCSQYASERDIAASDASVHQHVSAEYPPDPTRQSPQGPASQPLPFGHAHGNYDTPSRAPTEDLQGQTPHYRMEPASERTSKKALKRSRGSQSTPSGERSLDSAAPSPHSKKFKQLPNVKNGLQFLSYADALTTMDQLFRSQLHKVVNDDVEEVASKKSLYVLRIVKALNHKGFLPAPETKIGRKRTELNLDEKAKAKWLIWQNGANAAVKTELDQNYSQANVEFHAWEIIEEMIKTHRKGFRLTKQGKDLKSPCSERIGIAVKVIKEYAIVRQKLLEGNKIPDFCIGPESYAKKTIASHRNNSTRSGKNDDQSSSQPKGSRRIPQPYGAKSRKYPATVSASVRRRAAKAGGSADVVEAEGEGANVEEDVSSEDDLEVSPYAKGTQEGSEQGDEDQDEDADEVADDDDDDDDDDEEQGRHGEYEIQEYHGGQRGYARTGTDRQSYNTTPGIANIHSSFLPHGLDSVDAKCDYPKAYFYGSQQFPRLGNAPTQAWSLDPSTYSRMPAMTWAMEPEIPVSYQPTTIASSVVSATTPFDLELINPPLGMYSAQARTGGSEPSYGHRAGFTDRPAPTVPSNSFSDPCDPFDTGSAPPSVKRRRI